MAFGHSFLAMSGEESLAQVNRELEYPKHRNLMKAGLVIFLYSLLFTSLVSFFAYSIIPDEVRPQYFNNLISGISMYLVGPLPLKLLFQDNGEGHLDGPEQEGAQVATEVILRWQ